MNIWQRLVVAGAFTLAAAASADSGAPASGLWQPHQYDLQYIGFTSTYSCDGLQHKLELILHTVGARKDFKVASSGCDRGSGSPSKFARATLNFASLQPADNAADIASDASPKPQAGSWRRVELAPHRPFDLEDGDCELIEQFRDKILPLFTVRNVSNRVNCIPHQDVGDSYSLSFEVFAPNSPPKP